MTCRGSESIFCLSDLEQTGNALCPDEENNAPRGVSRATHRPTGNASSAKTIKLTKLRIGFVIVLEKTHRILIVGDKNVLGIAIMRKHISMILFAHTGILVAAEGRMRRVKVVTVHPYPASLYGT